MSRNRVAAFAPRRSFYFWTLIKLMSLSCSTATTFATSTAAVTFVATAPSDRSRHGSGATSIPMQVTRATKKCRQVRSKRTQLKCDSSWLSLEECLKIHQGREDEEASGEERFKFVEASWYHKGDRNGRDDFERGPRISGSVYFDLHDIASCPKETGLSHMLPTPCLLEAWYSSASIHPHQHVIIYGRDKDSVFLPRVWFTFQAMGHAGKVSIMAGSLLDWIAVGGQTDTEPVKVMRAKDLAPLGDNGDGKKSSASNSSYQIAKPATNVVNLQDMKEAVRQQSNGKADNNNSNTILLDARGSSYAKGYMPGAINIPYASLMAEPANEKDAESLPAISRQPRFKSREELLAIFKQKCSVEDVAELNDKRIICTCGTGVSACSLFLALKECGRTNMDETFVYDGSWEEWKSFAELPKIIGKT